MLKLTNIEVKYINVILVLKGVSLEVNDGSITALLGANGAGKTTTLKAISGLLATEEGRVTRGTIEWNGHRIENGIPQDIVKMGIVQVMEGRMILEHLTVEENLRAGACIHNGSARVKEDLDLIFSYFPRLSSLRNKVSGYLSGGEQQMLVMGRALMARPKMLLLDEPSLGLSPLLVKEIFNIIKNLNYAEKTSMLLVEQNAKAALEIAEYGYIMENGHIVLDGPSYKLIENEDVKEFYLGLSAVGQKKSYKDVKHYKRRKRWLS